MPADPPALNGPTDASEPTEPTEPTEPGEPTEPTEPTVPTEPCADTGPPAADAPSAPLPTVPADGAVVDRIVDGTTAVLLVGPDESPLELPVEDLPVGATDGTWLLLDLGIEPPRILGIDQERTQARRADVEDRLQQLRRTRSGGRFDAGA